MNDLLLNPKHPTPPNKLNLASKEKYEQKGKQHKSGTGVINIYNIVHNNNFLNKTQQIQKDPQICITTNIKKCIKPKNTHEQMLEQDLQLYKAEVEKRFKKSDVNRTYVYPRIGISENDVIDCYLTSGENNLVSIYSSEINKMRVSTNKSRSQEKNVIKLNGCLHSILKRVLRQKSNERETKAKSKESFYSTQKLEFGSQAHERKTAMESYLVANNQRNNPLKASHSKEPKIEEKSKEIFSLLESISMNSKKPKKKHYRTNTCNIRCSKVMKQSINEMYYEKNPRHYKSKTKSSSKDNVFSLSRGKWAGGQITTKLSFLGKHKGRNELVNTMNLNSFIKKCNRTHNSHSRKKYTFY